MGVHRIGWVAKIAHTSKRDGIPTYYAESHKKGMARGGGWSWKGLRVGYGSRGQGRPLGYCRE